MDFSDPALKWGNGNNMENRGECVLLAASGPKSSQSYTEMICAWKALSVTVVRSQKEAWKALQDDTYSMVVILSPLSDGPGYDAALQAAASPAGVLYVCRPSQYEDALSHLGKSGVGVFSIDMGRLLFTHMLQVMYAVHIRLSAEVPQTVLLQDRLKDIRIVSRAKCLLIQYEHLTEEQAHRRIEQEAMNSRRTRREVAQEIVDTYL